MDDFQKHYVEQKELDARGYLRHGSIHGTGERRGSCPAVTGQTAGAPQGGGAGREGREAVLPR